MQKKAENVHSISKLMQKRAKMQKKGRKYIYNFEIHLKKSKTEKRKHIYLDFFAFISPVHFLHFTPKNS